MADKRIYDLLNVTNNIQANDQIRVSRDIGDYRLNAAVLRDFLLDNSLTASTIKAPQSAVVKTAIDAINTILTTDNASFDDFQKITDAIESMQDTLAVDDADYNTLQEIADKLKAAEATLATLGTAALKDVGTAIGNVQENGATLGNSQTVETDATGKLITATKNTAYNKNFGTTATDVAAGDASYLKAATYTKTEIDNALTATSINDRARINHTGHQPINTVTGLQTALDAKEVAINKSVANGYASLDGNAQVPLSQLPANAKSSKVVADIATREVIANADRFEGLRVHVLNATADTTVSSGSAGYILKSGLANTDWEKVYESESIDVDLSDYFKKTTDTTDNITEGVAKFTTQSDIDKLAGVEADATADQTAAEIKTAYESNADTNAFTDAEKNKLTGIEANATADQSDLEIKSAYESNVNTNAFTDAEKTKLANLSKADVGLGNVNNTSDADKPISTAQQTALDAKLAKASNLSDVANRQTALNNIIDVASATNEYVLTKDTTTGNAVFKPAAGGGSGTNLSTTTTGTTVSINSDTGNDATIPAATSSNAGVFTSADKTKLDGIQANATADQTDAEIKTAYETNADTNVFTDAEQNKLAGINSALVGKIPTGSIVMSIASSMSGALKFDGISSYSKSIYSNLYTVLNNIVGTAFDVDANNFYLPDPEGRVLGIAGGGRTLFDLVGSDTHSLISLEIAAHTHNLKLRRDEGSQNFAGYVPDEGFAAAFGRNTSNSDQSANTLLTDRGANSVSHTTESAGSGQAHNIVQKTVFIGQNLFIYF